MHNNQITTSKIKEEDYQFQTQGKIQESPYLDLLNSKSMYNDASEAPMPKTKSTTYASIN